MNIITKFVKLANRTPFSFRYMTILIGEIVFFFVLQIQYLLFLNCRTNSVLASTCENLIARYMSHKKCQCRNGITEHLSLGTPRSESKCHVIQMRVYAGFGIDVLLACIMLLNKIKKISFFLFWLPNGE
jgi:hypothetical protein